jgi:hypothetical protein
MLHIDDVIMRARCVCVCVCVWLWRLGWRQDLVCVSRRVVATSIILESEYWLAVHRQVTSQSWNKNILVPHL